MLRFAKTLGCLAALVLGFESARGFSLQGPIGATADPWQVGNIGYNLPYDIGGPKNLGEEYRWNTPLIYYAFDQNFLDYFGTNGVAAVEQAIAILNGLTNFSKYSTDLSEFPLESQRINNRAQALHLLDLKSTALELMVEELGLTFVDRFTWTIRTRDTQPGLTCPFIIYNIAKRNFDPVTWEPSSYVNGNLLSYEIFEFCTGPDPLADAVDFPVDPDAQEFSAIMSSDNLAGSVFGVLRYGAYATGLSRDDVGGFRYLYRTNNMNVETVTSDSLLFQTNAAELLVSSNLTLLQAQALTNNAATLVALYPNLVITSTTNTFSLVYVTNVIPVFTTPPWAPVGTFFLSFVTNRTPTVQTIFHHTFANLVTFQFINGQWVTIPVTDIAPLTNHTFVSVQTSVITNAPWAPAGTLFVTNNFTRTVLSNQVSGEFFILPTNVCDVAILAPILTNIISFTNTVVATNNLGLTNVGGQFFAQSSIDFFTNHSFVVYLVNCVTNAVALRQGMDQFKFVRTSFDSLIGQFFQPITNTYRLTSVTNSSTFVQTFRRVVTRPDFLFSAQDLQSVPTIAFRESTAFTFNTNNQLFGLAGPGNIDPSLAGRGIEITFSKVGPLVLNFYDPFFILNGLTESTGFTNFIWASFNGSTNAPILYPNGRSIMELENQVLFQITTASLPDGNIAIPYAAQLTVGGGQQPYTWSPAQGSAPLPDGLTLTSSGLITYTPTVASTFIFTVSVMEAGSRSTTRTLTITINP